MNPWVEAHPWWSAIGIVGAVITVATIVVVALGGDDTVGENAFAACQIAPDFVEDALVAPGDADFGDCTARRATASTWAVSGRVDAPNAFGARIRHDYRIVLRYVGDDIWRRVGAVGFCQISGLAHIT